MELIVHRSGPMSFRCGSEVAGVTEVAHPLQRSNASFGELKSFESKRFIRVLFAEIFENNSAVRAVDGLS